ncbi:MAG: ATP-binding protein [Ruminococcus sp.]|nr:ATP-binding protein [Ruminococcus sp.]
MQSLFTNLLTQMTSLSDSQKNELLTRFQNASKMTDEEYLQKQCEWANADTGNLEGYDCSECKNRGYFSVIQDGHIVVRNCKCMKIRQSLSRLKKSGLTELAERCTFDSYITSEDWQKKAKLKAIQYVNENSDKWLFFGGQSGCGKTHLCTAICTAFINHGHDVKYILWRDTVHYLEQNRFNDEKYSDKIQELQNIEILYIDDFLKTTHKDQNGKLKPSENELNFAYEIINSRVVSGKKTVISSELHINDISALDEATGGRISAMTKGYQIMIKFEKTRNFRFFGKD